MKSREGKMQRIVYEIGHGFRSNRIVFVYFFGGRKISNRNCVYWEIKLKSSLYGKRCDYLYRTKKRDREKKNTSNKTNKRQQIPKWTCLWFYPFQYKNIKQKFTPTHTQSATLFIRLYGTIIKLNEGTKNNQIAKQRKTLDILPVKTRQQQNEPWIEQQQQQIKMKTRYVKPISKNKHPPDTKYKRLGLTM